jgi:orotidine-5'-phosphate decarboxylase
MVKSPIILALDTGEVVDCLQLIEATKEYIGVYKIGLEFFSTNGPSGISRLKNEFPDLKLFLDLKLHDIPNTVGKACKNLAEFGIEFLTVHCAGGPEMIEAAASAAPDTRITGVTVLTSLDSQTLSKLRMPSQVQDLVLSWAEIAVSAGAQAIVASPLEVAALRDALPREIILITPGIRPQAAQDDQKRVMTPKEALAAGADFLVIGRPITAAKDVRTAARNIFESLQ